MSHYDSIEAYTARVLRARAEYAAHPTVAAEQDWCPECVWPVPEKACAICTNIMAKRQHRKRVA